MGVQNTAAADEPVDFGWRTSSASGADSNSCVEAAFVGDGVLVRDSKDRTRTVALPRNAWRTFLAGIWEAPAQ